MAEYICTHPDDKDSWCHYCCKDCSDRWSCMSLCRIYIQNFKAECKFRKAKESEEEGMSRMGTYDDTHGFVPFDDANTSNALNALEQGNEELTDTNVGKWIPVTERLPKSGVHVLACCRVKWLGGGGRSYVCDAFYSAPKTEVCSYNDDIDSEYDEETDEYYMPEGWWEVIKNWDDFSCVAIGDFVTHWMPLPDPPKEESYGV